MADRKKNILHAWWLFFLGSVREVGQKEEKIGKQARANKEKKWDEHVVCLASC